MEVNELKPGVVLSGELWPEPIKVDLFEEKGSYIKIIGSFINSNKHLNQLIPKEKLININIISTDFKGESDKFFLAIETLRYRYASLYDPLLAVNISKIDPLPHQIEAVYGYILKQPRIRFLIADDPGAGKTIMAGLIIKELKLRHIVQRILIVCPGHLKDQWKRELKDKFDENFSLIDRRYFDEAYHTPVWEKENQIITSLDFAKQSEVLQTLAASNFDLIIVDEAHKMSAFRYGDKVDKSERYKLGEVLSKITNHLIFLTATPHRGDPENFRLFLDLLEPGFFANLDLINQSIQNKDNPLFIRRIKEELKDFEGKPLFLPRHVNTVKFNLSEEEKELYNELSKYVEEEYNKANRLDKRRNVAFALTILQRRFASSIYALLKSLERRKEKLEELLNNETLQSENKNIIDVETIDEMAEEDREEIEKEWETVTISTNDQELKKEIGKINDLIEKAKSISYKENEVKLSKFKELLKNLKENVKAGEKIKVLVFTESRDTLEYLEHKVRSWGYSTTKIHGGMNMEERVAAESTFKNNSDILIATEAAGEGINLQFCNLMINYDIPWNPNRLEQRMGRIHRYGQTKEVFAYNLVNIDTREGKVLNKLFEKIEEIKNALGSDKVFDVLGEVIDSRKFTEAIINAAVNAKTLEEILAEIDFKVDEKYIQQIKENLGETLATHYINYSFIKEMALKAKENRLIPEYTQNYFIKAFEKAGGRIEKNSNNTFQIKSIPYEIRKISENEKFKKVFGTTLKNYPSITFDKEVARRNSNIEFVSFGHPLFEAVMQWVENSTSETLHKGAIFYDPDGKLDGYLLFYEGEIRDGKDNIAGKRIFSFFYSLKNNEIKPLPPSIMWDLKEGNDLNLKENPAQIENIKNEIEYSAIEILEKYRNEIFEERKRQAEIKEKYGVLSLQYLIDKLDGELVDLYSRKEKGELVDLAIYNKEERKRNYEKALEDLRDCIKKEQSLSMSSPKFIGMIRVLPFISEKEQSMSSDEEIEAIGMKIAMEYEIKEGRNPQDVSCQNLGYDIRSLYDDGTIRYIEVKARALEGDVALTQNEWFKAQRFGDDYYLYVIFNAIKEPKLYIIQNPAKKLNPEQKIELVRFLVKKEDIIKKKEI